MISATANGAFGIGLVAAGAVVSSKVLMGLGTIGLAGAVLLASKK